MVTFLFFSHKKKYVYSNWKKMQMTTGWFIEAEILLGCTLNAKTASSRRKNSLLKNLSFPSPPLLLFPLLSFFALSVCLTTWTNCLLSTLPKFFSIYWDQSLPIQALSDIMPDPIKRRGGKEWMLSSSPISCKFLVQFSVSLSLSDRQHTAQPLFFFIAG